MCFAISIEKGLLEKYDLLKEKKYPNRNFSHDEQLNLAINSFLSFSKKTVNESISYSLKFQ